MIRIIISLLAFSNSLLAECSDLDSLDCLEYPDFCSWNQEIGECQDISSDTSIFDYDCIPFNEYDPIPINTTDYANMDATASQLSFESTGESIDCRSSGSLIFTSTVDQNFTGITTTVGNKNVNLGVDFKNGLADPEINKNLPASKYSIIIFCSL